MWRPSLYSLSLLFPNQSLDVTLSLSSDPLVNGMMLLGPCIQGAMLLNLCTAPALLILDVTLLHQASSKLVAVSLSSCSHPYNKVSSRMCQESHSCLVSRSTPLPLPIPLRFVLELPMGIARHLLYPRPSWQSHSSGLSLPLQPELPSTFSCGPAPH